MAPTEAEAGLAPLVEMRETDVPAGFALSEEAGWNQTAEDWALLIRLGRAFGVPGSERSPRRDRPRAAVSAGVRLDRAWCSCTARTGGAGSRRA